MMKVRNFLLFPCNLNPSTYQLNKENSTMKYVKNITNSCLVKIKINDLLASDITGHTSLTYVNNLLNRRYKYIYSISCIPYKSTAFFIKIEKY